MTMTQSGRSQADGEKIRHGQGDAVQRILALERQEELEAYGEQLAGQGFAAVRRFLEEVREYLRTFMDKEAADAATLVERLRVSLPAPGSISPSWQDIWDEFGGIVSYKTEVLGRIEASLRAGEWQVLLDNPYSNQHIAVYPGLTFQEAAYMYAYFRTGLEHSEYIRLQKVETVIFHTGADS